MYKSCVLLLASIIAFCFSSSLVCCSKISACVGPNPINSRTIFTTFSQLAISNPTATAAAPIPVAIKAPLNVPNDATTLLMVVLENKP